jgi:diguanylate cyclase (GGDEF)-like protein
MAKGMLRAVFEIPSDNTALMRSQVRVLSRQVPLLYFIIVVNTVAIAWTFFHVAPLLLTTGFPALLIVTCVARLWIWVRARGAVIDDSELPGRLATTVRFAAIFGTFFLGWSLALYPYADAYMQGYIAFSIFAAMFGGVICVMPLRPAALVLSGVVVIPGAIFLASTGHPVLVAIAINMVLVSIAVVYIVFSYSRDFASLIDYQQQLVDTHRAETEATRLRVETARAAEGEILRQAERLETALNNMLHGLVMFDANERLIVCNERYAKMYALPRTLIRPGAKWSDIIEHRLKTFGYHNASFGELFAQHQAIALTEHDTANMHELGDGRTILVHRKALKGGGWVATHEDITERRRAELQISYMANHDALTGLGNRAVLHQKLEEALTRKRQRRETFAILLLDLDGFKHVNDTLGHATGDDLLKELTERLNSSLPGVDTLARLGGDEFAVIQRAEENQREAASALAMKVLEVVSSPFTLDGRDVTIGVSIGIAVGPEDGLTPGELLRNADLALYRVKSDGRNNFRFFEKEMSEDSAARLGLIGDLRLALARDEFELHYQPVFDAKTREPRGVEALVRWRHPTEGLVPPDRFIPLAEETGLMEVLGEWILDRACKEAMAWPDHIKVAVNLSATQFRSARLLDVILCALVESGLPPERLELEITESVLMQNAANANAVLKQLKNIGISIALDDFGTGYSSLSYLTTFPFDKIKIDKSFTQGLFERSDCAVIVASVLTLARGLNIEVTAEGVETKDQSALLDNAGVNLLQGFLFGRPQPAHELKFAAAQQDAAVVQAA